MAPFFFLTQLATHTHDDLATAMIVGREVFFLLSCPFLFFLLFLFLFFNMSCLIHIPQLSLSHTRTQRKKGIHAYGGGIIKRSNRNRKAWENSGFLVDCLGSWVSSLSLSLPHSPPTTECFFKSFMFWCLISIWALVGVLFEYYLFAIDYY